MKIAIYQPVIPKYRVPLFNAVARRNGIKLTVFASKKYPYAPSNTNEQLDFSVVLGDSKGFFGNRLIWQYGFNIPDDYEYGDVVVISGNIRILSNIPLIYQALRRGIAIVWWGHGWVIKKKSLLLWIKKYFMNMADMILLYTDKEVEQLSVEWDGPPLLATNNTIDIEPVEMAKSIWLDKHIEKFKREQGLEGKKIIIFCSRLNVDKNVSLLITALKILVTNDSKYTLVIIGDGPERKNLENQAINLGLSKSIIWTGEIYEEEKIAPWFISSHVFAYPGPIGLSIAHAFSYALPVIIHDYEYGHKPEYCMLENGVNGLLYQKDNEADLAKKIRQIFSSEQSRVIMSQNAYKTIRDKYSMQNMVDRFINACKKAQSSRLADKKNH